MPSNTELQIGIGVDLAGLASGLNQAKEFFKTFQKDSRANVQMIEDKVTELGAKMKDSFSGSGTKGFSGSDMMYQSRKEMQKFLSQGMRPESRAATIKAWSSFDPSAAGGYQARQMMKGFSPTPRTDPGAHLMAFQAGLMQLEQRAKKEQTAYWNARDMEFAKRAEKSNQLARRLGFDYSAMNPANAGNRLPTPPPAPSFMGRFMGRLTGGRGSRGGDTGSSALMGAAAGLAGGMAWSVAYSGISKVTQGLRALTFGAIETGSQIEQMKLQFQSLLGTGEQTFGGLMNLAKELKMPVTDLGTAFARMVGMGITPSAEALKTLIGYARATGNMEHLQYIVLAISQIASKGKVEMQEMRQLAERGVPWQKILKQGGMDISKFNMADLGKQFIPASGFIETLLKGMDQTAQTGLIEFSKTFKGSMGEMGNAWIEFKQVISDNGGMEIAKETIGTLTLMLQAATNFAERSARLGEIDKNANASESLARFMGSSEFTKLTPQQKLEYTQMYVNTVNAGIKLRFPGMEGSGLPSETIMESPERPQGVQQYEKLMDRFGKSTETELEKLQDEEIKLRKGMIESLRGDAYNLTRESIILEMTNVHRTRIQNSLKEKAQDVLDEYGAKTESPIEANRIRTEKKRRELDILSSMIPKEHSAEYFAMSSAEKEKASEGETKLAAAYAELDANSIRLAKKIDDEEKARNDKIQKQWENKRTGVYRSAFMEVLSTDQSPAGKKMRSDLREGEMLKAGVDPVIAKMYGTYMDDVAQKGPALSGQTGSWLGSEADYRVKNQPQGVIDQQIRLAEKANSVLQALLTKLGISGKSITQLLEIGQDSTMTVDLP